MPRRRAVPLCIYCDEPGLGEPPLCQAHYEGAAYAHGARDAERPMTVAEFLEALIDHPDAQAYFDRVRSGARDFVSRKVSEFGGGYAAEWPPRPPEPSPDAPRGGYAAEWPAPPSRPRRGRRVRDAPPPPPPPSADTSAPASSDPARVVMGFRADQKLTESLIKQRRRSLASMFHPDHGGSDEAMQRVNDAADRLLAELN